MWNFKIWPLTVLTGDRICGFFYKKMYGRFARQKKKSSRNDKVAVGRGYTVCRRPLISFSPGRVLLGILHGRVPLGALNSDPISRLFTVPYFFVRSFRYTASYRHGYLDFQM